MKLFYRIQVIVALLATASLAKAQQPNCTNNRYLEPVFSTFSITTDVTYGSARRVNGAMQDLKLDVYQPDGDDATTGRPLVIFAHGGGYISGTRDNGEVSQFCERFARLGYVTATITYRLSEFDTNFNEAGLITAALRATQDARRAIRFFYNSVKNDGNPYRIDTNLIFFGGSSAGAGMTLQQAFMNTEAEFLQIGTQGMLDSLGGIYGDIPNPQHSLRTRAVINLCGVVGRSSWIQSGEPDVISFHGTADNSAPYRTGQAGIPPVVSTQADGSWRVDSAATSVGVRSLLITWPGVGHVPHNGTTALNKAYADQITCEASTFLYKYLCNQEPDAVCTNPASAADASLAAALRVYPVPAQAGETLYIDGLPQTGEPLTLELLNLAGQQLYKLTGNAGGSAALALPVLPSGVYVLRVAGTAAASRRVYID